MAVKVADVTYISLRGYHWEKFDNIEDAFAYVADQLRNGDEQFEIKLTGKNGDGTIHVDARDVEVNG